MLAALLPVLSLAATLIRPPDFTTAGAVRSLPVETARSGRAVALNGVVTFSPARGTSFYLQDKTGGVGVNWLADRDLRPGERVRVIGATTPGTFLPEVKAEWVISTDEPCEECLPRPAPYTLTLDDSGYLDGQWVASEAVVQRVWWHEGWLKFDLARGRGSAVAAVPHPLAARAKAADALVGTVVRVRGVCQASTNAARQVIGPPKILVGDLAAFVVIREREPAARPATARELTVFRPDPIEARLPVRIDGVITFNQSGRQLYVHDGRDVVHVILTDTAKVQPGDRVRVTGFPRSPAEQARLENAVVVPLGPGEFPAPQPGTPALAAAGRLDGQVVKFAGLVHEASRQGAWMTLTVVADGLTFTAVLLESLGGEPDPKPPAEPGSTIEVVGVATRLPLEGIRKTAFVVAVRPGGLTVLSVPPEPPPPSWWTNRRVAYLSAGFLGLFLLGGASMTALRVQVRRAKALARTQSEEKARLEGRLEQAARLEAVGLAAGGVAHDFNNILTVINGCAQMLDEELSADPRRAATLAADICRAGRLATALNALLLAFSRQRTVAPHPLDVNAVIADSAPVLGRLLSRGTDFRVHPTPGLPPAMAETGMLLQVLINLTVNAGEAMPDGGKFVLATSAPEPGWVRLTATDTGTGMTAAVLARAFERGFTTKHAGTGTGLSTVAEVVRVLGGRVRVRSEPGRGSEFEVDLPAAGLPALPPPADEADDRAEAEVATVLSPTEATSVAPSRGQRAKSERPVALLVDDDEDVRSYIRAVLDRAGWVVLPAADAESALALLATQASPVELLLTDFTMPGLSGRELAARVRAARPGVRVLFVSGSSADECSPDGHAGEANFLQKPFTPAELLSRIKHVLTQPA